MDNYVAPVDNYVAPVDNYVEDGYNEAAFEDGSGYSNYVAAEDDDDASSYVDNYVQGLQRGRLRGRQRLRQQLGRPAPRGAEERVGAVPRRGHAGDVRRRLQHLRECRGHQGGRHEGDRERCRDGLLQPAGVPYM